MINHERPSTSSSSEIPLEWRSMSGTSEDNEKNNEEALENILSSIDIERDTGSLDKVLVAEQLRAKIMNLPESSHFDIDEKNKLFLEWLWLNGDRNRNLDKIIEGYDDKKSPEMTDRINTWYKKTDDNNWFVIKSPELNNDEKNNESTERIKLYLSVDNSNLHLFARNMMDRFDKNGRTDIDFKINNDEESNSCDNIVVYCNRKNFIYYSQAIEDIAKSFDEKSFNSPHPLGFIVSKHIRCGLDKRNDVSFTEAMCREIVEGLSTGLSTKDIIESIKAFQAQFEGASAIIQAINQLGFEKLSSPDYLLDKTS